MSGAAKRRLGLAALLLALGWLALRLDRGLDREEPDLRDVHALVAGAAGDLDSEPIASADDVRPTRSAIAVESSAATEGDGTAVLRVRVLGLEDGRPLRGADVTITPKPASPDEPPAWRERSRTDEEGIARFSLYFVGAYRARVDVAGDRAEPAIADVPALRPDSSNEMVVRVRTERTFRFHGRVVADSDGTPIAGARVAVAAGRERTVSADARRADDPGVEATTSPDGRFDLLLPDWREYSAAVAAAGWSPARVALGAGHASPEDEAIVRLERSAAATVRVLERADRPIRGVIVRWETNEASLLAGPVPVGFGVGSTSASWEATTDERGEARLSDLPAYASLRPKIVEIVSPPPRLPRDRERVLHVGPARCFAPGDERELEIAIGAGATIDGRAILENGDPLRDHPIGVIPAERVRSRTVRDVEVVVARARTDADGRFRLEGIRDGSWWIGALRESPRSADGASPPRLACVPSPCEVVDGIAPAEVVVRVARGEAIRGTVADVDGRAVARCPVRAWRFAPSDAGFARSDADGRFEIGELAFGPYEVSAGALVRSPFWPVDDPIVVAPGDGELVLRVRPAGALSVRVVDATTRAYVPARVRLLRGARDAASDGWDASLVGGRGSIADLAPGEVAVLACAEDGRCGIAARVVVRSGESTDVEVEVSAGAALRLTRSGGDATHVRVELDRGDGYVLAESIAAGSRRSLSLPAGTWTLRTSTGRSGPVAESPIRLEPGERRDLVVEPP